MDFGGRAWKEALPAKLAVERTSSRPLAQTQSGADPASRARDRADLPGPPPRNRRCPGSRFPALFHAAGRRSVRRGRVGDPLGRHRQRKGQGRLRTARRRDPEVLVAAGHQHRRLEVFPRPDGLARARAQRQAADRPRRRHHHEVGARASTISPATMRCSRSATS